MFYLGYALIQLPESLLSMYKAIKIYFDKCSTTNTSVDDGDQTAVNQMPHIPRVLKTSPNITEQSEQCLAYKNTQQNDRDANQVHFNAQMKHEVCNDRIDKIERQIQEILSILNNMNQ